MTERSAFKEAAAFLEARAAGNRAPALSSESATQAVVAILEQVLPEGTAPQAIAAVRAASVWDDVRLCLAGEPRQILHADDVTSQRTRDAAEAAPSADDILRDAQLVGEAQARVLSEPLLDANAVGALLGSQSGNRRQYATVQRQRGELLGVPRRNAYLYPAFQFDLSRGSIHDTAKAVNRMLGANDDPWGVASWWTTPSERLAGRAPKDLLGSAEEPSLLDLAQAESEPIG